MSSRHYAVNALMCCASSTTVAVDWSRLVSDREPGDSESSPLDSFNRAHVALIKLSGLVGSKALDADASSVLAGQILLGYVSATELFLRETISVMAIVCPYTRKLNQDQMIRFGALDYYDRNNIGYAISERVSFSESGMIRKHLSERLGLQTNISSSLGRAIEDFERLCQVRHALIHSHGVVNSSNASALLRTEIGKSQKVTLDEQGLQWAASVAVNLSREVTAELYRSTIWKWVMTGYLQGNSRDRRRISRLVQRISSSFDAGQAQSLEQFTTAACAATKQAVSDGVSVRTS